MSIITSHHFKNHLSPCSLLCNLILNEKQINYYFLTYLLTKLWEVFIYQEHKESSR